MPLSKTDVVIIAGMTRAGTTTLYYNLQQHPQVYLPLRKETNYFTFQYDRGLEWFLKLYRHAASHQVGFDISPGYFFDPLAIERMKRFNPKIKVVLGIRDPVEWVLSLYYQCASFDLNIPPFEKFIKGYILKTGRPGKKIRVEYRKGMVTERIAHFQESFGDRLLLYHFKLFEDDLLSVLRAIETFVGIPFYFNSNNIDNLNYNSSYRRSNKFLAYFARHELFISLVERIFPDTVTRFIRKKISAFSVKNKTPSEDQMPSIENICLAEKCFEDDRQSIAGLFSNNQIQLGSGIPFS